MNEVRVAKVLGIIFIGVTAVGILGAAFAHAQENAPAANPPSPHGGMVQTASGASGSSPVERAGLYLAMALSIAGSSIGAGYAVGKVGSAAIGAVVERPELLGRSLIFVGLAEGIAIYGLLVALMLMKMG